MNVERYLNQALEAEHRIHDLQEQRAFLMDLATGVTQVMNGMPSGSPGTSKIEGASVKLADLDHKLSKEMTHLAKVVEDITGVINQVPDEKQRRLLHLRYLCGKSWREVQRALGYTNGRSVYYTHRNAKRQVLAILKERDLEWLRQEVKRKGSLTK